MEDQYIEKTELVYLHGNQDYINNALIQVHPLLIIQTLFISRTQTPITCVIYADVIKRENLTLGKPNSI